MGNWARSGSTENVDLKLAPAIKRAAKEQVLNMTNNKKSLLVGMMALGFAQVSAAAGTIAGTDIDNTAVVSYEVVGTP